MKKKQRRILLIMTAVIVLLGAMAGGLAYIWFGPQFHPAKTTYLYIDPDDTGDSVRAKLYRQAPLSPMARKGFEWMARLRHYDAQIHTGRYAVRPSESVYHVLSRLLRGYQEPMNLVVGSTRTIQQLARNIGRQLLADSADIATVLTDSILIDSLGYDAQTLPALIVPNTYEVYWDMTPRQFLLRMAREHERFWTQERRQKANRLGMTPVEVATLASIVEEETNRQDEKPIVAGLYINRLRLGMPLQADPTVRFAIGDFSRQRVTNTDLQLPSPYNTYLHPGLPPGPIRIATPQGLDAVLNHTEHNYLYMCAKEDLSGRHNFAANYNEHLRNARRYQQELNKRKIFR